MSVKTVVSAGQVNSEALCSGIESFLKKALEAQGLVKGDCVVSLTRGAGSVKMHGSESAEANFGIVSFSDTEYQIGINETNGEVSFVYDSWVSSGSLQKRVDGQGERGKATNLVQCEMLRKAQKYAHQQGRAFGLEFMKEGGARAFVPNN